MKLASYYKVEEKTFCQLVSPDETELEPYEQMLWDCYDYSPKPLYSGIYVDIKEGITESEELKKAVGAISNLAYLFEYDYGEC